MPQRQYKEYFDKRLREQFSHVIRSLGQELLPEDGIVTAEFFRTDKHITIDELKENLAKKHPKIEISHIRRTMRMLCELGIAQKLQLKDKEVYEHLHLDNHHDHLVCVICGKIEEFIDSKLEKLQHIVSLNHGFTPLMHKLEIRGVCSECAKNLPATQSLANCIINEEVKIVEIVGCKAMSRRFAEMGLNKGKVVRILNNNGPVIIELMGSRVALGKCEAEKIIAVPVKNSNYGKKRHRHGRKHH
jgi:Fur family ferric uptake transcriptional regulator